MLTQAILLWWRRFLRNYSMATQKWFVYFSIVYFFLNWVFCCSHQIATDFAQRCRELSKAQLSTVLQLDLLSVRTCITILYHFHDQTITCISYRNHAKSEHHQKFRSLKCTNWSLRPLLSLAGVMHARSSFGVLSAKDISALVRFIFIILIITLLISSWSLWQSVDTIRTRCALTLSRPVNPQWWQCADFGPCLRGQVSYNHFSVSSCLIHFAYFSEWKHVRASIRCPGHQTRGFAPDRSNAYRHHWGSCHQHTCLNGNYFCSIYVELTSLNW